MTAYRLDQSDFHHLWLARPLVTERLVSFLCRRLREKRAIQLESIALHPLHVRLARSSLLRSEVVRPRLASGYPSSSACHKARSRRFLARAESKINAARAVWEEARDAIARTIDRIFCDPAKLLEIAQFHPMLREIWRNRPGVIGGALVYLLFATAQLTAPLDWISIIRERGFDAVLWADMQVRAAPQAKPDIIVVDIDRAPSPRWAIGPGHARLWHDWSAQSPPASRLRLGLTCCSLGQTPGRPERCPWGLTERQRAYQLKL